MEKSRFGRGERRLFQAVGCPAPLKKSAPWGRHKTDGRAGDGFIERNFFCAHRCCVSWLFFRAFWGFLRGVVCYFGCLKPGSNPGPPSPCCLTLSKMPGDAPVSWRTFFLPRVRWKRVILLPPLHKLQ